MHVVQSLIQDLPLIFEVENKGEGRDGGEWKRTFESNASPRNDDDDFSESV